MPKKNLGYYMRESKKQGVSQGIDFMAGVVMLAMANVVPDYLRDENDMAKLMRETEAEINRIYKEVLESVPHGEIDEMAERIAWYVQENRRKWRMDDGV